MWCLKSIRPMNTAMGPRIQGQQHEPQPLEPDASSNLFLFGCSLARDFRSRGRFVTADLPSVRGLDGEFCLHSVNLRE